MHFSRSAAEYLRRHNVLDSAVPLPSPRLAVSDLWIHRVPVHPKPVSPPILHLAEGDPPPDRVIVLDIRH